MNYILKNHKNPDLMIKNSCLNKLEFSVTFPKRKWDDETKLSVQEDSKKNIKTTIIGSETKTIYNNSKF